MGNYIPHTDGQTKEMLGTIGFKTMEDLISSAVKGGETLKELSLPAGLSEMEVLNALTKISRKNKVYSSIFRGAGAYGHYIPAMVKNIISKETFLTAYTPYQPEMAQGILQSIFEYQTMICELTGLEVSNASVYDGATAAAEAASMCRDKKRSKTLISAGANPDVIETVKTYCWAFDSEVAVIPADENGRTDIKALEQMLDDTVSGVYIAQPNYWGVIEDCEALAELVHKNGAKFIMGVNPIAMGILKTPGECGADIAVGEGQPLGMPLAFGGPYLGFMAAASSMLRKLPGRIVGQTTDKDGKRAFVLTLQAREQHIRREKAASNICSNQALCAMTAAVYMAVMGPEGLKDAATLCYSKAHYLAQELEGIGFKLKYGSDFFCEFVTTGGKDTAKVLDRLSSHGILGGLPVEDGILWCVTEKNTKEDIDRLVSIIKEEC